MFMRRPRCSCGDLDVHAETSWIVPCRRGGDGQGRKVAAVAKATATTPRETAHPHPSLMAALDHHCHAEGSQHGADRIAEGDVVCGVAGEQETRRYVLRTRGDHRPGIPAVAEDPPSPRTRNCWTKRATPPSGA